MWPLQYKREVNRTHTGADVEPQAEVSLSKDVIKQAQGKDELCQQIMLSLSEGKQSPYLSDQDAVLYYRSPNSTEGPKIVVPASLREQVIRQHHDSVVPGTKVRKEH